MKQKKKKKRRKEKKKKRKEKKKSKRRKVRGIDGRGKMEDGKRRSGPFISKVNQEIREGGDCARRVGVLGSKKMN